MSEHFDVIVVGSGASAAHAVWKLVEAGKSVVMLDVGYTNCTYAPLIPERPFEELRRHDPDQHRYLLGDHFEGIPLGPIHTGAQLTPPRQYVYRDSARSLPIVSTSFAALQSLALGGLGASWGAGAFAFLDSELERCRLPMSTMRALYEVVAQRIGISGGQDDLAPFFGALQHLQPPLAIDTNAARLLRRYQERRSTFHRLGVRIGQPPLAVLTQPLDGRRPNPYHDMDFWSNTGESVYRPQLSVRALQKHANFHYCSPYLVETFTSDTVSGVHVQARCLTSDTQISFGAKKLILAAGTLASTRIVLRSLQHYDTPVPLLCNAHSYIPCIHYRHLGQPATSHCHSLAQLSLVYDASGDKQHLVQGQFFSYRSLLLFRLLKDLALPYREALRILRAIAPALVIVVLQHEDNPSDDKYCVLRRQTEGSKERLEISYQHTEEEQHLQAKHERVIARALRLLGCWPRQPVRPGYGASIHYAGSLPMTTDNQRLTTTLDGALRGIPHVYVADGSILPYLPAKGLTLTLMANADRIGTKVLQALCAACSKDPQ